jgi:hypothetical protein
MYHKFSALVPAPLFFFFKKKKERERKRIANK